MLKMLTHNALITITTLACLIVLSGAAPIDAILEDADVLTHRGPQITNPGARAGRSGLVLQRHTPSSSAIVKHVKPACNGSICNHAAFFE